MKAEHTYAGIERAVALMSRSLGQSHVPTLDELANAACISKFHFIRIYQLVTGESCSQTMQRLRLAQASSALAHGGTVTEAAMTAGYGSSQALAKALRRSLGQSATELRREPDRLARTIEQLGSVQQPGADAPLSIELASLEPFTIIAVRTQGRYAELASVYQSLADAIGGMGNIKNIFGVSMNNSDQGLDGDLVFHCGFQTRIEVNPLPDEAETLVIAGDKFLVGRHHGSYERLGESMDMLYWGLLERSDLDPADRPMFMHYLDDPEHTAISDLRTDIYLPVLAEEHLL